MFISDETLVMDGAEFTVKVDRANVFGGADPIHTVIYSTAKVHVDKVVKDEKYDWPDYDAYDDEIKELDASFAGITFKVSNSDGETKLQMIPKN